MGACYWPDRACMRRLRRKTPAHMSHKCVKFVDKARAGSLRSTLLPQHHIMLDGPGPSTSADPASFSISCKLAITLDKSKYVRDVVSVIKASLPDQHYTTHAAPGPVTSDPA